MKPDLYRKDRRIEVSVTVDGRPVFSVCDADNTVMLENDPAALEAVRRALASSVDYLGDFIPRCTASTG